MSGLPPGSAQTLRPDAFTSIPSVVETAIQAGQTPGAVILIGHQGKIVFRQAFGHRIFYPEKQPMEVDTLFDIASITKVVATVPAVMQLADRGKLKLEDPVSKYWPEFRAKGKGEITIQELMTHYSGLRPGLPVKARWKGYKKAMAKVRDEKLISPPGNCFEYSDINFMVLGELVRRLSGKPLDEYCGEQIFAPLGMKNTLFNPPEGMQGRMAATRMSVPGKVHDPLAYKMGGVSGHAGAFSTADDLAIFAEMLLNDGRGPDGRAILAPGSVEKMVRAQSPPGKMPLRGLGWSIHSPSGSAWSETLPPGSYANKGFTGTLVWIDPVSRAYLIVLTNRVYPHNEDRTETLREEILSLVIQALGRSNPPPGQDGISAMGGRAKVQTGIDILAAQNFSALEGLRIGLITNHSGLDCTGRRTIDLLARASGTTLKAIFGPEHGLSGQANGKVPTLRDPATGLPVYSLYGDTLAPHDKMLKGLDVLVFDIQDAGVRFYTYATTMAFAMEAAAGKGLLFYVLDRPNPLNGSAVQGPVMDKDLKSFTGYFPMPIRHGMTVGELARMFNAENHIGARLKVIPMAGYRRSDWFDDTGLKWINPSPNLRSLTQAILYGGSGLAEGANVSVGRGTGTPFELLGSPWIDSKNLHEYLTRRKIPGVKFEPADFTPESDLFKNQVCHGIKITLTDRAVLDPPVLGVEILSALYRLYPQQFLMDKTLGMVGARWVLQEIKEGRDPRSIAAQWEEALQGFLRIRSKYLLY